MYKDKKVDDKRVVDKKHRDNKVIQGSIVALVTPMKANGEIAWLALDRLVQLHIDAGTHAIVAVGTTGESATLSVEEHTQVIERVVDFTAGRIPVIAGTGANSTSEAIELTENAARIGADACLLVTPYYNKPMQEGLYQHFCKIAEAIDIPQILYNVPARTACDMLPETVLRLSKVAPIIGIKEATGDLQRAQTLIDMCDDKFAIYSGDDSIAREFILIGGKGNISVTANVTPALMARMCEYALSGNADQALELDKKMQALHKLLFIESNPIPVKWALHQMGLIEDGIRLPLTPLQATNHAVLRKALVDAGVLKNRLSRLQTVTVSKRDFHFFGFHIQ